MTIREAWLRYCGAFHLTSDTFTGIDGWGMPVRLPYREGDGLLLRDSPLHVTASALVYNRSRTKVLFAYHNIYQSYAWPGGHSDGDPDPLAVAARELKEESGLEKFTLFSACPVGVHILPVKEHEKRGRRVAAHRHLNFTFAFYAEESAPLYIKPDENSALEWLDIAALSERCSEPHMLPVYQECLCNAEALVSRKESAFRALPELLPPWFRRCQRDLPWRHDVCAYRTWVSEIMLQQTRVEAGRAYFERFLSELPDVYALAACPEDKLMKLWEGLGYYNRARNLQKTAKRIVEEYGGIFPSTAEELEKLPGIGEYTAGAIASIAFDRPAPAVDGNVMRVVARITEDYRGMDDAAFKDELFFRLQKIYPPVGCGDFTQSLMELGAIVCLPNGRPLCEICPMAEKCMSRSLGVEELLPVPKQKPVRARKEITVFVFLTERGISLQKRRQKGVLNGLWEFPNVEGKPLLEDYLAAQGVFTYKIVKTKSHTHVFTHLEWDMTCYYIETEDYAGECYTREEILSAYSVPSAFRWILKGV